MGKTTVDNQSRLSDSDVFELVSGCVGYVKDAYLYRTRSGKTVCIHVSKEGNTITAEDYEITESPAAHALLAEIDEAKKC